jgi:hypothetical protein
MNTVSSRLVSIALATAVVSAALVTGASAPAGHYTISSGTVYDNETKLTWQQAAPNTSYTWAAAKTYCSTLNLNGPGWRLPTAKEIFTIVDVSVAPPGPTLDATAFPGQAASFEWTTTPAIGQNGVLGLSLNIGSFGVSDVTVPEGVRCVR